MFRIESRLQAKQFKLGGAELTILPVARVAAAGTGSKAFVRMLSLACLAALLVPALCFGQAVSGDLVGGVLDPSGSAVANAQVAATNTATGVVTPQPRTKLALTGSPIFQLALTKLLFQRKVSIQKASKG